MLCNNPVLQICRVLLLCSQGALEEAQLISWPTTGKVSSSTDDAGASCRLGAIVGASRGVTLNVEVSLRHGGRIVLDSCAGMLSSCDCRASELTVLRRTVLLHNSSKTLVLWHTSFNLHSWHCFG
jgi:hypothetical protein